MVQCGGKQPSSSTCSSSVKSGLSSSMSSMSREAELRRRSVRLLFKVGLDIAMGQTKSDEVDTCCIQKVILEGGGYPYMESLVQS